MTDLEKFERHIEKHRATAEELGKRAADRGKDGSAGYYQARRIYYQGVLEHIRTFKEGLKERKREGLQEAAAGQDPPAL